MKKKPTSSFPEPRYIVDKTGKKVEVILDIKVYDPLIEIIEDFCVGRLAEETLASESKQTMMI